MRTCHDGPTASRCVVVLEDPGAFVDIMMVEACCAPTPSSGERPGVTARNRETIGCLAIIQTMATPLPETGTVDAMSKTLCVRVMVSRVGVSCAWYRVGWGWWCVPTSTAGEEMADCAGYVGPANIIGRE